VHISLTLFTTTEVPKCKFQFPGHQTGGHERNKIKHKGSLGYEDDAQTFSLCAFQCNSMHACSIVL